MAELLLELAAFLATFCAGTFAGAAVYITFVEHPARMRLETRYAALQWPSYQEETRALLAHWGKLHSIRSALSLISVAIMLWQLAAG